MCRRVLRGTRTRCSAACATPPGPWAWAPGKLRSPSGSAPTAPSVSVLGLARAPVDCCYELFCRNAAPVFVLPFAGHCPSADNPRTVKVETDCEGVAAKNSRYRGAAGNLCQVRARCCSLCTVLCTACICIVHCSIQNFLLMLLVGCCCNLGDLLHC